MENCVVVDIRTKELSQTEEIVNLSHSYKLGQNTVEDGGADFFEKTGTVKYTLRSGCVS